MACQCRSRSATISAAAWRPPAQSGGAGRAQVSTGSGDVAEAVAEPRVTAQSDRVSAAVGRRCTTHRSAGGAHRAVACTLLVAALPSATFRLERELVTSDSAMACEVGAGGAREWPVLADAAAGLEARRGERASLRRKKRDTPKRPAFESAVSRGGAEAKPRVATQGSWGVQDGRTVRQHPNLSHTATHPACTCISLCTCVTRALAASSTHTAGA